MNKTEKLLTQGLSEGFAGKTQLEDVKRGFMDLKSSEYSTDDGKYIDQWIPGRVGGGQELVSSGDEKMTRLYAGGTIPQNELEALGITEKDVMKFLIKKIKELGDKTRLHNPCLPAPEEDWEYTYEIKGLVTDIQLTLGLESICYKGTRVFVHGFLLSPVE